MLLFFEMANKMLLLKLFIFISLAHYIHAFEIKNFPGSLGVEIHGMDLSQGISAREAEFIKKLVYERLVVVIRDQNLTARQQTAITTCFGDVEIAWDKKNRHSDDCRVHVITNDVLKKNPHYISSTYFWHWDKSFIRYPTSFSFAFFPTDPQPDGVGTTGFINLYNVYSSLSENLKEKIASLSVIHSYDIMSNIRRQNYEKSSLEFKKGNEKFPDVIHPIVGIHPSTGKKTVNVDELSQGAIIGISEEESNLLRKQLFDHAMQTDCHYYHNWKKGDFVIWDNLALVHRGMPSDPSISRILHRTNISSRSEFEGRCLFIASDLTETELSSIIDHLFTPPLVLNTDSYEDLIELENDIQLLRSGNRLKKETSIIYPHAIVIITGEKWKKNAKITSFLHAYIPIGASNATVLLPKRVAIIPYSHTCGEALENFCVEHYLVQDMHERLMSGELSVDHLNKKLKILVASSDTYTDESKQFLDERLQVHAQVLYDAFKNTSLNKPKEAWLEYLHELPTNGIQKIHTPSLNKPWLLFLDGGQGAGKTTLANQLVELIGSQPVIINSKIFFSSLFNDVPYTHKVILWPFMSNEKKYLTLLITQIAMAHQISVLVDTHILFQDFCAELTAAVREYGGKSIMIALYAPLDICYMREQTCSKKDLEGASGRIYEQMMFHKLFALNWSSFIKNFDTSFLIDQNAISEGHDPIIFLTENGDFSMSSEATTKQFLDLVWIDPDELASELALLTLEQSSQAIRTHIQNNGLEKIGQYIPDNTRIVEKCRLTKSDEGIENKIEDFFQKQAA